MIAPPSTLLKAGTKLESIYMTGKSRLMELCSKLEALPKFARKAAGVDVLFVADYDHNKGAADCDRCVSSRIVARRERDEVVVYYGILRPETRSCETPQKEMRLARISVAYFALR